MVYIIYLFFDFENCEDICLHLAGHDKSVDQRGLDSVIVCTLSTLKVEIFYFFYFYVLLCIVFSCYGVLERRFK